MTSPAGAPDYDRGYLRVPLSIWSALYCQTPLTRRQLQLCSVVLRESWGWRSRKGGVYLWTRPLSARQFQAATGLATDHLTRDLRDLIARGILRERERRYQLVPDPQVWKTRSRKAPKERSAGAETTASTAKTALSPSVLKKANKEQRNVEDLPESELSPSGDNLAPGASPSARKPGLTRVSGPSGGASGTADRLAPLIDSFVGALSPGEAAALRAWIRQAGVVPVWDTLEPFFRQGRRATRQQLQTLLNEPRSGQSEGAVALPGEVADA